jgi:hypothetical protein
MAAQPDSRENFQIQDNAGVASKPAIDPSQFWKEGNQVKLTLRNTTPDALVMTSPYSSDVDFDNGAIDDHTWFRTQSNGNSVVKELLAQDGTVTPKDSILPKDSLIPNDSITPITPITPNDSLNPKDWLTPKESLLPKDPFAPKDLEDTRDPFNPRPLFDQRDTFLAAAEHQETFKAKEDPRVDGDQRDIDAMMEAMKSGNLDDLKHLVADMSPEKLKRISEHLNSIGFEMSVSKDGKFTVYDPELGLGVSVDSTGKASVVKKDANGDFVGQENINPKRLLHQMSSDIRGGVFETYSAEYVGGK